MIRLVRRVFHLRDRRSVSRAMPIAPPLPSTRAELIRTAPAHRARLRATDRFLADVQDLDGALRLIRTRR